MTHLSRNVGSYGWRQGVASPRGFTMVELIFAVAIIGTLAAIGVPTYKIYYYKAQVVRAIAEIRVMEKEIYLFAFDHDRYPDSLTEIKRGSLLDPWKSPYQYLDIGDVLKEKGGKHPAGARKDRHEVPINSDYDLYSMGRDQKSKAPLMNPASFDDVIRANDGVYVGLASEY
jgi:general secretion pathway protein G